MVENGSDAVSVLGFIAIPVFVRIFGLITSGLQHVPTECLWGVAIGAAGLIGAGAAKLRSIAFYFFLAFSIAGICGLRILLQLTATDQTSSNNQIFVTSMFVGLPIAILMIWICTLLKPWYLRYLFPLGVTIASTICAFVYGT